MHLPPGTLVGASYRITRVLGEGGMGVVYEATDEQRGGRVALKTVRQVGGDGLARLKLEFRAIADLSHPNLVSLYELIVHRDELFIVMEYLEGTDLLSWLRGGKQTHAIAGGSSQEISHNTDLATREVATPMGTLDELAKKELEQAPLPEDAALSHGEQTGPQADFALIRDAFRQLAAALAVLHGAGLLHRDIKPSNVVVTKEGRVVLLDFGVITELSRVRKDTHREGIVGTLAYMAPEAVQLPNVLTEASDWYAVGLVLYEALTGWRPFARGESIQVRQLGAYAPVKSRVPEAPDDLAQLCEDLLDPSPKRRPTSTEILSRLGSSEREIAQSRTTDSDVIVGREHELSVLHEAWAAMRRGNARAVVISGESGLGKSALIDTFIDDLGTDRVIVLRGRCFARERVPFKGLDSVVDQLSRVLAEMSTDEQKRIIPDDSAVLSRTFPVLRSLPIFAQPQTEADGRAAPEQQRKVFSLLLEMMRRLAERKPLIVYLDDLHWGDIDIAPFFSGLLSVDGPPILFLATVRAKEAEESALYRSVRQLGALAGAERFNLVSLAPLSKDVLERLARSKLKSLRLDVGLAAGIADEARGSPYFVHELVRYAMQSGAAGAKAASLQAVIADRATTLSEEARSVLQVVAVGGGRMPHVLVRRAAGITADTRALVELVSGRFVRSQGDDRSRTLECYHDSVRESVLGSLSAEARRAIHWKITEGFQESPDDENIFALAHHMYEARPEDRWKSVYELNRRAGELASASFAYDQARVFLGHAEEAAKHAGISLDATFLQLFGDACALTGHLEKSVECYQAGLSSDQPLVQASMRLGLTRVWLAQLNSDAAIREVKAGLEALKVKPPMKGVVGIFQALWVWWRGGPLAKQSAYARPLLHDRALERERSIVAALSLYAHASYFKMDRIMQAKLILFARPRAARLGPCRETAWWAGAAAATAAIVRRPKVARQVIDIALRIAEASKDPVARAKVLLYKGHTLHFMGDPIGAEKTLLDVLHVHGAWLENTDFMTGIADYAWVNFTRGRPELAWSWIQKGLERAAVDGARSVISQGHTFRCYAGPVLAALGRVDEAKQHLSEFRALIEKQPDDRWRWAQWLAHSLMLKAELGEIDEAFDAMAAQFGTMKFKPKNLPLQIRHVYIAHALGLLIRCERQKAAGGTMSLPALDKALHVLASIQKLHPTLACHGLALQARRALLDGRVDDADMLTAEAEQTARATENAWVTFETYLLKARIEQARGRTAEAEGFKKEAISLAQSKKWPLRAKRAESVV